jgi:hypothetical protein
LNKINTNAQKCFPFTKLFNESIQGTYQICTKIKTKKTYNHEDSSGKKLDVHEVQTKRKRTWKRRWDAIKSPNNFVIFKNPSQKKDL